MGKVTTYKILSEFFSALTKIHDNPDKRRVILEEAEHICNSIKSLLPSNVSTVNLAQVSNFILLEKWKPIIKEAKKKRYYSLVKGKENTSQFAGLFFGNEHLFFAIEFAELSKDTSLTIPEEVQFYLHFTNYINKVYIDSKLLEEEVNRQIQQIKLSKKNDDTATINDLNELIRECTNPEFWNIHGSKYQLYSVKVSQDEVTPFILHPITMNPYDRLRKDIYFYANATNNILITGDSGSGKEMVAKLLHNLSDRKDKPFIPINIAALSRAQDMKMVDNELKGHVGGSYAGAKSTEDGAYQNAKQGTLFLDELGDVDESKLPFLFRDLDTKKYYRIGGKEEETIEATIIGATSRPFYELDKRMSVSVRRRFIGEIILPLLKERILDIPLFINYYFHKYSYKSNKYFDVIPKAFFDYIIEKVTSEKISNVREIEKIIYDVIIYSDNKLPEFRYLEEAYRKYIETHLHSNINDKVNSQAQVLHNSVIDSEITSLWNKFADKELTIKNKQDYQNLKAQYGENSTSLIFACAWLKYHNFNDSAKFLGIIPEEWETIRKYIYQLAYQMSWDISMDNTPYENFKNGNMCNLPVNKKTLSLFEPILNERGLKWY